MLLPAAWAVDNVVLVTSQAQQNPNDSLSWAQLGPDQTLLAANFNVTSANTLKVGVSLTGANSVASVVCAAAPANCSWTNGLAGTTPMTAGDSLLWTSDALAGGNGPVTLNFNSPVAGAGLLLQANAPGAFTARVQAFNGASLLATFTLNSDGGGDPLYIGVKNLNASDLTQIVFSLTACGATDTSNCADFGVDTVQLNAAGIHFSVVPSGGTQNAGAPFNVTVTALDRFGNTATGYSGTVHFTSSDPQVSSGSGLPADSTLTSGVGMFTVTLKTAGSQSITATDTVSASITGSGTVTVNPAAAQKLSVAAPPMAMVAFPFNITVTALDQFGNTATGYTGTVHFTSSDPLATLPADSTLTNGVGTFSATLKTVGSQSITATDTVTSSITGSSGNINVVNDLPLTAGPPRNLRLFRGRQPVIVATFTDADNTETGAHLSASINWGDGTTATMGTIMRVAGSSPNTFQVLGSHAYARKGQFTVTVTVTDSAGPQQVMLTATVRFLPRESSF